jgi:FkbM family methyltransferase
MAVVEKILNSKAMERTRRFLGMKSGVYFKLKRFSASTSTELRTQKLLEHFKIDCVLDVGGNTGQFAESLLDFGFTGKVVSFEPVSSAYAVLEKRSQKHDKWTIAERSAIGSEAGEVEIHISDNTVFSSILDIKSSYVDKKPGSRVKSSEMVPIYRLDDVVGKYADMQSERILLKIDTQGFEKHVLDGCPELLKHVQGIKIEIPLYPIYEGVDFNFYEILDFLKERGFHPYSFNNEGVDHKIGRVNTIDGVFFRHS